MRPLIEPAGPDLRARLKELAERPLPVEEWRRLVAVPLTDDERERTLELVQWFTHRYPTAGERLAYVRRAYRRWAGGSGPRRG